MQSVLLQLKLKKILPDKINALEMFGMHGLWHTRDYVNHVGHLDIFEIDPEYHRLSKKALAGYPVSFYCDDSIKYISATDKKYNFIVADIPFGGDFYKEDGLPRFFSDMIRVADQGSVLIFNCHSVFLSDFKNLQDRIRTQCDSREVKDLFFVARNSNVSYIVLALT